MYRFQCPTFCFVFLHFEIYKIFRKEVLTIYNNKKSKGNFFLLPNSIFDEDMKPRDFAVYSFLVSRKDSVGECWYSVERIAEYCNISVNTARRALHWLEEWGYIEIKKSFLDGKQRTNLYRVHKIAA